MLEILEKLRVDFKFFTGANFTGIAEALCLAFSSRLSEFDSKTRFIEKQAFIETADKNYLFLIAGNLLPINPAKSAKGSVMFFGERLAVIPKGTLIKSGESEYVTTEVGKIEKVYFEATASVNDGIVTLPAQPKLPSCSCIANGVPVAAISTKNGFVFQSDSIPNKGEVGITVLTTASNDNPSVLKPVSVDALIPGKSGNKSLSDILQTKTKIPGIDQNIGAVSIAGGEDIEGAESYRKRVKHFIANPQAPFSQENIRQSILSDIPAVFNVWVLGGEVKPGYVEVFISGRKLLTPTTSITDVEKKTAGEIVQGLRPPNIPPSRVTVTEPTYLKTEIKIKNLVPANKALEYAVQKNLQTLFLESGLFNKGLSSDAIKSAIYRSRSDAEAVQSFELVSGEIIAKPKTLYILDAVTFT